MARQSWKAFFVICGLSAMGTSIALPTKGSTIATGLGAASSQLYNAKETESQTAQRVRIPLTLKAWNSVDTKSSTGKIVHSKIVGKPMTHVLRARIEKPNDFFLGDWRIQSTPIRWLQNSGQYQVRLEVFRRFGDAGTLEENLGSVTLTGVLQKQDDHIYLLNGTARKLFRDRMGQPLLDFEAGQHTEDKAISRR